LPERANTLFSKDQSEYKEVNTSQDVLYSGDVSKWRKFANSLALRYYLRISTKEPAIAKAGIEKITGQPDKFPIILSAADDAAYSYIGLSSADSWPTATNFSTDESNFTRVKMCATLLNKLKAYSDPRIGIWAAKVKVPLQVDPTKPADYDETINGVRIVSQEIADEYQTKYGLPLDLDQQYVGYPPAWSTFEFFYNLSTNLSQGEPNLHASQLNDMYKEASGPLLKVRMLSAAEIHFDLAEIALKGWNAGGTAADHYNAGVQASLDAWDLGDKYDSYIAGSGVAYNGTLAQIMEQKWIASWTAAAEAWFDFNRTGLPALVSGPTGKRAVLPVRFQYGNNEVLYNPDNTQKAVDKLELTNYSSTDGKNGNWSKTWLYQGTGKPW